MITTYHSSVETPMRSALKQMLRDFDAKHQFTLAFHDRYSLDSATAKIATWYRHMMRRLFGRGWFKLSQSQGIEFFLLPEAGPAHLHFHGPIRIPPTHLLYFERIAALQWKHLVPTGTFDFGPIEPTPEDHERYYTYVTKCSLASEILHSSMLCDREPVDANRILTPSAHRSSMAAASRRKANHA